MRRSYEHSREDVRAIQNSFRRYLARIHSPSPIRPDHLLQAANSQRRDIFQLFREELEELKADTEPYKSYLRGTVPPHYQQDLEQEFLSAGTVAMATSTPEEKPVSGTQQPHTHAHSHTHTLLICCQGRTYIQTIDLHAQQTNLLPENASQNDTFFSQKSISDICNHYGCAITIVYT